MGGSTTGGGTSAQQTEITQDADPGILTSLTVFTDTEGNNLFETYVTAGIRIGSGELEGRRVQLLEGYVSYENAVTWTGKLTLVTGDIFYMNVRGNLSSTYKFLDSRATDPDRIKRAGNINAI